MVNKGLTGRAMSRAEPGVTRGIEMIMAKATTRRMSMLAMAGAFALFPAIADAQERLPWQRDAQTRDYQSEDLIDPPVPPAGGYGRQPGYGGGSSYGRDEPYRSPQGGAPYRDDSYRPPSRVPYADNNRYGGSGGGYGQPYEPPREQYGNGRYDSYDAPPPRRYSDDGYDGTYSTDEIRSAGHRFFGSISQGLASVIEYAFKRQGRPNGYILGEDAGGAFIAGLRYGEGVLYTKDAGSHKVYWQGPSLGYDAGGEGSKVMVLVYNLRDPNEIYDRFGGVSGSAYVVGGVSLNFQAKDHIVLAPIRSGIGLRLGANVGYLKYTRRPTWNPF
jgi:hypothetical protein